MAHKKYCSSFLGYIAHFSQTLLLKSLIAYCQHLIHYQDFRLQVGGHSKRQTHIHTAGITFYRA